MELSNRGRRRRVASPSGGAEAPPLPRGHGPTTVLCLAVLAALGAAGCSGGADAAEALRGSTVTVAEENATYPTVALDPAAQVAYVAWIAEGSDGPDVLLSRVHEDGTVDEPVRVNDRAGRAAAHEQAPPQVRVGPDGTVHVAWQSTFQVPGRRFPASDLHYAHSDDGGRTFTRAIYVNDDAGELPASHAFHDLVVGKDGTVWVSWIDGRERARAETAPTEVRVASLPPGASAFGPSVTVADEVCPCCRTSLALAADGTLYLAWRRVFPGDIRDVVLAWSADGGSSFSEPVRVAEDGWHIAACPHAGPSVAVDAEGAVHLAWYTGREGAEGVYHAVSADGGRTFGARRPLTEARATAPTLVRLAQAGSAGGAWAVWDDRRGEPPGLRFALLDAREGVRAVRTDAAPGFAPALDARDGRLAVAWLEEDAVRLRLASP